LGIEIIAAEEGEAGGRVEHRDVHPFHLHAHDLGLGVVVALDGEVQPAGVEEPRSRERLAALGGAGAVPLPVLLQVGVRDGHPVDDDQAGGPAPRRAAVGAHRHADAVFELGVQIALEEVGRFHDVHVGVDEPEAVLHGILLRVTRLSGRPWDGVGRTIAGWDEESSAG